MNEKFSFQNSAGQTLCGRLDLPVGQPRATALFAHCFTCGKDLRSAGRISRALTRQGVAVLRFDFTGLGDSEGDFANTDFSSNLEDLRCAARALEARELTPEILVGHSLGGAAVLAIAGELETCRAVVTIGAPSDPEHLEKLFSEELDLIREGKAEVRLAGRTFTITRKFLEDIASQKLATKIQNLRRPLLVFHAPLDNVVGIENARAIFESAYHPKSFISLDTADHLLSNRRDAEYVATTLAAWASRYISEEKPSQAAEGEVVVEELEGLTQGIFTKAHSLLADEPERLGGANMGPTPYDLLLAGLGACTSMTLRMYARHKKIPLESVQVKLRHRRTHAQDCEQCETSEGKLDVIEREVFLQGELDQQQRTRLLEIADRCPVHKTLTGRLEIHTRAGEIS